MPRAERRRRGFTLPEVMVAIVVSGLVLLGARATVEAVHGLTARSAAAVRAADRAHNGERMLRRLVEGIGTGEDERLHFAGDDRHARFITRCDVPAGWTEPCAVRLEVQEHQGVLRLIAHVDHHAPIELLRASERLELAYLHDATNGGTLFRSWGSSIVAPVAIAVRRDAELLLLPIGAQG